MKHVKVLDCTLRDGAYLVDKYFGDETIIGIVEGLVQSNIDIIEIGFLQDEGRGRGKPVYKNSIDAQQYIPASKGKSEFAVLADCSRYSVENLDACNKKSFTIVRECFFKKEREQALNNCRTIKQKGYKVFVQPVDIMGYSDVELLEFVGKVNELQPYALSIVDTFGSMYQDDLERIFTLLDHNLAKDILVGFHSHNNLQLSNSLTQTFINNSFGKREVVVDTTICGMGRGAGNTPTELIIEYMNTRLGYHYDLDSILDIIDTYFGSIFSRCSWGYSIPYFIAGANNAHVNNVHYLLEKSSIKSKDIRYILNCLNINIRKRYHYDILEKKYIERVSSEFDDTKSINKLNKEINGRNILLLLPGKSIILEKRKIVEYIEKEEPCIIAVNFIPQGIRADYVYFNNVKRYKYYQNNICNNKTIITSNIAANLKCYKSVGYIISFEKLIKCGWNYMDNSGILCLRLIDRLDVGKIKIAGFDGFLYEDKKIENYCQEELEINHKDIILLNEEIREMLIDYKETRIHTNEIKFLTKSIFENIF